MLRRAQWNEKKVLRLDHRKGCWRKGVEGTRKGRPERSRKALCRERTKKKKRMGKRGGAICCNCRVEEVRPRID